jgi:putative ABC transport system substrate-binding protein
MIRRREFVMLLGGAAAWPLAARAQQPAMPVIGFLGSDSFELSASRRRSFLRGLSETGYVEGRNLAVEYRWAEGQNDRLPALMADLVHRQMSAIFVNGVPGALAAKAATTTIPIVFIMSVNPVELGLVATLSRPGGNLTGSSNMNTELNPKRLELLHELIPTAIIGLLVNPTNPNSESITRDMQAAARILGVQLYVLHASTERDFDTAFNSLVQLRVGGLVIGTDPFFALRTAQLAALAAKHAVPAIYENTAFATAGGLMGYGRLNINADMTRLAGNYTGRILKGEKPADLPVMQPTRFEFVINLKTAKALGLTIPETLLATADEVIQ